MALCANVLMLCCLNVHFNIILAFVEKIIGTYLETHANHMHLGVQEEMINTKEVRFADYSNLGWDVIVLLSELKMQTRHPKHL